VLVVFTVTAIYTKYNAVFFVVTIAISLIYAHGKRVVCNREVLEAVVLGVSLLLPILAVFSVVSSYNLAQATAVPDADATRCSFAALTFYARIMPSVISGGPLLLGCLYLLAVPFVARLRLSVRDAVFLATWVLTG
jgi:hypothetical protein